MELINGLREMYLRSLRVNRMRAFSFPPDPLPLPSFPIPTYFQYRSNIYRKAMTTGQ